MKFGDKEVFESDVYCSCENCTHMKVCRYIEYFEGVKKENQAVTVSPITVIIHCRAYENKNKNRSFNPPMDDCNTYSKKL